MANDDSSNHGRNTRIAQAFNSETGEVKDVVVEFTTPEGEPTPIATEYGFTFPDDTGKSDVTVKVTDKETGEPVEGVEIRLTPSE